MSSDDIAIRVSNLSKRYEIYNKPGDRLKQFIIPKLCQIFPVLRRFFRAHTDSQNNPVFFNEFWALKDVSFEIKKGETVGIIGRNGSGKSTLLQLICGTLNPTAGEIKVNGRIAALLELGAGFNPEFTGRENVRMSCALLGMTSEETEAHFEEIAAFADIGEFIEQPVKTYSSGMFVRLAFAVNVVSKPDVLIVDEALAVGDAKFQAKCFKRLKKLHDQGTTIILVTHSTEQIVTHCIRAILIDGGVVCAVDKPNTIVNQYLDLLFGKKDKERDRYFDVKKPDSKSHLLINNLSKTADLFSSRTGYNPNEYRWGSRDAVILDYCLVSDGIDYPTAIVSGHIVRLAISIKFNEQIESPILGISIKTTEGITVYGVTTDILNFNEFKCLGNSGQVIYAEAQFTCCLAPGDYFISLGLSTYNSDETFAYDKRYDCIHMQVQSSKIFLGIADLNLSWDVVGKED